SYEFEDRPIPIRVWDVAARKQIAATQPLALRPAYAVLSGDGRRLATWGAYMGNDRKDNDRRDRTIQVWDAGKAREVAKLETPEGAVIDRVVLSRDGRRLAVCCDGLLVIWDVTTGKEIANVTGRRGTHA